MISDDRPAPDPGGTPPAQPAQPGQPAQPVPVRPTAFGAARSLRLIAAVALVVIAADQLTKSWAVGELADGPIHVAGPLSFTLALNKGSSFSLSFGPPWFYAALAISLSIAMVAFSREARRSARGSVIVGLIAAGALGNAIDRVFRDTNGAVVDFVKLGWWPIFNVADAAISIGLVLYLLFSRRPAAE